MGEHRATESPWTHQSLKPRDLEAGRPSLLPSQTTGIRSGQLQRSFKQDFGARHVGQIQHQGRVPRKSDTATCAKRVT